MQIQEIKPLMDLLHILTPRFHSDEDVEKIQKECNDRVGEFCTKMRPSDVLLLMRVERELKAKIEAAQLEGKDSI